MGNNKYGTIIIGGGAAGLMCASFIHSKGDSTTLLLEKMEKPSRKVRITGKGRCNVTNICTTDQFLEKVRSGVEFLSHSLNNFSTKGCIDFFEKEGVRLTVERGGRVFPTSMKAADIANGLEYAAKRRGATIVCNARVKGVEYLEENKFEVTYIRDRKEETVTCSNVVIATGGVSYPSTGSTGDGYQFAYDLKHDIEPIRPALVPLVIECRHLNQLERLVLKNINLKLVVDGEVCGDEFGEIEFFTYGIGGSIAIRLSRSAVDAIIDNKKVELELDLKPSLSIAKILGRIERELLQDTRLNLTSLLRKMMPMAMIKVLLDNLSIDKNKMISSLTPDQKEDIAKAIKGVKFKVVDYENFDKAIVTAGGVDLSNIDPTTMESKLCKGLYFAGEVMDVDADTGGYNLQIAFSTAVTAATAINRI